MGDINSYIYRMGTAPNTRVAVSQKNKVYGYTVGQNKFQQFGVTSEFTLDESRTIDPVRGIGYGDTVAELVPSVTEPMTMTLNKSLLYAMNIFQMIGYKGGIDGLVRSLRHHRWPFDIKQELVFSELVSQGVTGENIKEAANQKNASTLVKALMTYFEGCWLNSYGTSYTSDAAIVTETSSVTVTDIVDGVSEYGEFLNGDTGLSLMDNKPGSGASRIFGIAASAATIAA
jgi:hypothetical protein